MTLIDENYENIEPNQLVELDFEIGKGIRNLMNDKSLFYHIYVTNDMIRINKEGYNTPPVDSFEFNLNSLDEELKKDAIRIAYYHTFLRTGDLLNRISVIEKEGFADTHNGSKYAFYHDRTGLYPESEIVNELLVDVPELRKVKVLFK